MGASPMSDHSASEQVTYSAAQLRKRVAEGAVKEAHPHAGMVPNADARELLNTLATAFDPADHPELDSIEESELYQTILRNEATSALTDAVEAGNVSQMQYGVGMVNHDNSADNASAQGWLRSVLLSEAYVGWVTGGMGSGKTDFALDRADDFHHATRGSIGTNIQSAADRNDPIEFVGGYDDMEQFYRDSSDHTFMILDETDQQLSGKGGDAKNADVLADALKLVRKGDSSGKYRGILLVGQTIRGASKELRRLVTSNGHLYHKVSKTRVEVYDDVVTGELSSKTPERTITGVKPTRFNFQTGEASSFDMSGALDDDGDSGDMTELSREQAIETALRAVKPWDDDIGVSQADAGDIVGYSAGWVNDRVREWRNGDHREKVNDPRAQSA